MNDATPDESRAEFAAQALFAREVEAIDEGIQAMERGDLLPLREFDLQFRKRNGIPLS